GGWEGASGEPRRDHGVDRVASAPSDPDHLDPGTLDGLHQLAHRATTFRSSSSPTLRGQKNSLNQLTTRCRARPSGPSPGQSSCAVVRPCRFSPCNTRPTAVEYIGLATTSTKPLR